MYSIDIGLMENQEAINIILKMGLIFGLGHQGRCQFAQIYESGKEL